MAKKRTARAMSGAPKTLTKEDLKLLKADTESIRARVIKLRRELPRDPCFKKNKRRLELAELQLKALSKQFDCGDDTFGFF